MRDRGARAVAKRRLSSFREEQKEGGSLRSMMTQVSSLISCKFDHSNLYAHSSNMYASSFERYTLWRRLAPHRSSHALRLPLASSCSDKQSFLIILAHSLIHLDYWCQEAPSKSSEMGKSNRERNVPPLKQSTLANSKCPLDPSVAFLSKARTSVPSLPLAAIIPPSSTRLTHHRSCLRCIPSSRPVAVMSFTSKIQRTANAPTTAPDEIEQQVAQAILDLENNVPELKSELRVLQISAAKEVDVKGGKKAVIIFVPVPQLKAFHKVQQR
jgi:hypothetical protein